MNNIEEVNETYAGELKYLHSIAISLKRIADAMTKPLVVSEAPADEFMESLKASYGIEYGSREFVQRNQE